MTEIIGTPRELTENNVLTNRSRVDPRSVHLNPTDASVLLKLLEQLGFAERVEKRSTGHGKPATVWKVQKEINLGFVNAFTEE